jgi:type II secretory pathway component PulM
MPDPPRRSKVPLLERDDLKPHERVRIGRAASALLAVGLAAIAAIGWLAIWHLVRRGRLIRQRLAPPRVVRLLDLKPPARDVPPAPDRS